jgi:predicted dehydrogenase
MKKIYKICVVGAGRWGLNHVKTLNALGHLGGVVDENRTIVDKVLLDYPGCLVFSSLESSFGADFDGYVVATPAKTHFEISKKIIENGKPLLVEKPITLSLDEAIIINDLAKKNNVNLMVGHILLFHPAFIKIKELIDNGDLGKIQYMYSNRLNLGSFRNDENVLWSFAPHDIALFNYFLNDFPLEIISSGIDILQKNIHDTSITSFKYTKNRMGHIFVSWLHPFKEHRFVIVGSKGMIHFEDSGKNKPLIFYDKTVDLNGDVPISKLGMNFEIEYGSESPLKSELSYFISKIEKGKIEIADGNSAVAVMKVLEQATKSLKGNR